jgi:dolichyl-diphosphooligosaccharide---protein glycosyltransferase
VGFIRKFIGERSFKFLSKLFITGVSVFLILGIFVLFITGKTRWSGRSMTLLDPTYAKNYIPIIASVSEHQSTTWSSYFFDLHFLMFFMPVGLWYCFKNPNYGKIFAGIYVVLAVYFASVMIRLLLVLAPAACIVGGIGVSQTMRFLSKSIRVSLVGDKKGKEKKRIPKEVAIVGLIFIGYMMSTFILHSHFAGSEAYASPSIIMSSKDRFGNRHLIDDYREAYYWLRMNTKPDDKIMSWWDYGY